MVSKQKHETSTKEIATSCQLFMKIYLNQLKHQSNMAFGRKASFPWWGVTLDDSWGKGHCFPRWTGEGAAIRWCNHPTSGQLSNFRNVYHIFFENTLTIVTPTFFSQGSFGRKTGLIRVAFALCKSADGNRLQSKGPIAYCCNSPYYTCTREWKHD